MSIARTLGGKGERRNKTRACRGQSSICTPMHGNNTAEAFITRQWLPDSPKNSCSLWHLEDIGRQTAVPTKIIRYWLLVSVARLAGSWSHRMRSATVARLHWPSRLPPKSLKISIRQRQARKPPRARRDRLVSSGTDRKAVTRGRTGEQCA